MAEAHSWPQEVCGLVAWHTRAETEAGLRGFGGQLAGEFPTPPAAARAVLTWSDLTSSPVGERCTPANRLAEVLERYPAGTVVHMATRKNYFSLLADVSWVDEQLRLIPAAVDERHSHWPRARYPPPVPGPRAGPGGVKVPSPVGFNTHSDGDVLCHALIDALAGAIADGDLGTHFPEDDPDAEDARSLEFVREFAGHVRRAGYEPVNVDVFVVLGTVKLRPHIDQMRANVADARARDRSGVSQGSFQRWPRAGG